MLLDQVPPGVTLAGIGGLFLLIGIGGVVRTRVFLGVAARVQGRCVHLVSRSSSSSHGWTYHPVLEYPGPDGRLLVAESPFGSSPAPARPGQWVTVLYDPAHPHRPRVDNARGRGTLLYAIFVVVGALVLAIGVVVLVATA